MSWWMYLMPFVANLAICVEVAAVYSSAFIFFIQFINQLPSSVAILLVFAYVVEFEKQLPVIENYDDIRDNIMRYEKEIQEKINKINWGFILPNIIFWVFVMLDGFWITANDIENQDYDWAVYDGLITFFAFLFALTFLIPTIYFTYVMNTFVSNLDKQYCKETGNVLPWLKSKELGWKLLYILMSPELFGKLGATLGAAVLTGLAKLI